MDGHAAVSSDDEWVDVTDVVLEEKATFDEKKTPTPITLAPLDAWFRFLDDPLKAPVFQVDDVHFVLRYENNAELRKAVRGHATSYFAKIVGPCNACRDRAEQYVRDKGPEGPVFLYSPAGTAAWWDAAKGEKPCPEQS